MASQDPLLLLRSAVQSTDLHPTLLTAANEPSPTLPLATYISFPQSGDGSSPINILKDTPTRYTSKADSRDEFYTLGALWLAWSEKDSAIIDYLKKAQGLSTGFVGVTDRRGVVEYLQGENDGVGRVVSLEDQTSATAQAASSATVESLPAALDTSAEAGPSKTAPVKRKYEVNVADREFCKKMRAEEIELRDRTTVLRTSGGGKAHNFSSFLSGIMSEKIKALRTAMDQSKKSQPSSTSQSQAYDPTRPARKAKSNNPIILISSSPTALITMWNVRKFLEQGIFEPSEIARQREASQGNTRVEDMTFVNRKRTGPNGDVLSKYYVVDSVEALQKFGADAWDRVICVLTTGQAWQFKPYKWQDPRQLFRNVKGVYFQWNNEPSNPVVKDWNVTEMRIERSKRHVDRQVVADFWRILDSAKKR